MFFNLDYANKLMETYKLDALIATDCDTLKYLGYDAWINYTKEWMFKPGGDIAGAINNFCIIPLKNEPVYLLSADLFTFLENFNSKIVYVYGDFKDKESKVEKNILLQSIDRKINNVFERGVSNNLINALKLIFKKNNLLNSRIGIEKIGLNKDLFENIKILFSKCEFIDATEIFRILRMIKTQNELENIKKCAKITENAAIKSIQKIKPGNIFGDTIKTFNKAIMKENAVFDHYILLPKGLGCLSCEDYIIENNSIFGIDVGAFLNNYVSDTALTIFIGTYSRKDIDIYKKLLEIMDNGFKSAKPGVFCSDIFHSMKAVQKKYNLSKSIFEGHGIGISCREYPIINKNLKYSYYDGVLERKADFIIEENMVFNIEVAWHIFNIKTFQIEKTFIITGLGCEELEFQDRIEPIYI